MPSAGFYRFVPDAAQERATLDRESPGMPATRCARYAALQDASFNRFDPSALRRDRDDAIRAGDYGIRNLKYIMDNLPSWIGPTTTPTR